MNKTTQVPFGLHFEEFPTAPDIRDPLYDDENDLSVVIDQKGHKIPFVEYYGTIGTKTYTAADEENTDTDQNPSSLSGTRTMTKTQNESSDSDDETFLLTLGTKTLTHVQSEQTDEDPDSQYEPKPPLSTRTVTRVMNEDTDRD